MMYNSTSILLGRHTATAVSKRWTTPDKNELHASTPVYSLFLPFPQSNESMAYLVPYDSSLMVDTPGMAPRPDCS